MGEAKEGRVQIASEVVCLIIFRYLLLEDGIRGRRWQKRLWGQGFAVFSRGKAFCRCNAEIAEAGV